VHLLFHSLISPYALLGWILILSVVCWESKSEGLDPKHENGKKMRRLGGTHERGQMKVTKVSGALGFSNKCMSSPLG
jgi:hypothetical protein